MRSIDIEIVDDFVSPSYLKEINEAVNPKTMQWHFQGSQSISNSEGDLEDFGFSIKLCPIENPDNFLDTRLSLFMRPLVYQIKDYAEASSIVRSRLDLTLLHKQKYIHPPHIDIQDPKKTQYVSAILYINDTDGDTIIYDHKLYFVESSPTNMRIKKTIAPKPGRLLLFNGSYVHTGHSPNEHQTRILLNTVLS